ncbi:Z1 domain-containing protein [Streptomyces sp. NPDC055962]|uniref:Z1 domain-containing protein n=1 Tax=Streptomyces sp. NPDC055962 TaxID=3345667 RepID=UPI0035D7638B
MVLSDNPADGTLDEPRADLSAAELDLVEAMRAAFVTRGLSLRAVARELSWDFTTVSRYLRCKSFPPAQFVEQLVKLAGDRLSAADADRLRRLHDAAKKGRKDPQHQIRTLSAQVRRRAEQAKEADRKSTEAEAALNRALTEIRRLRTQLHISTGSLEDRGDAFLTELDRYAAQNVPGARDTPARVRSTVLASWRAILVGADSVPTMAGTDSLPRTRDRRCATYDRLELEQRHRDVLDSLVPLGDPDVGPLGEATVELHDLAFETMVGSGPRPFARAVVYVSSDLPARPDTSQHVLRGQLTAGAAAGPLVDSWRRNINRWDHETGPRWTDSTPRSAERRIALYEALALEPATRRILTELIPISFVAGPIVIGEPPQPWATPAHLTSGWYWPAYKRGLRDLKGWPAEAVTGIDEAADRVVERLADPTDEAAYQTKGLVMGYVQSGKTASFTGVIAKAVDRGYRLVIVLSGTLNLLRAQTQRRLDMELVGRENILRGAPEEYSEYADDPAWQEGGFLSHGELPSRLGAFDVIRLTTRNDDYRALRQGITALEFEKADPALPFHHPHNLHRSAARLMVVKKNKAVLGKVVSDLRRLGRQLEEVPVLIVDDESDHGSVNTAQAGIGKERADRTAINGLISELLVLLPRAQYVAYTATPFANVLINPADQQDLFPKDFVIALPRPSGYMGAREFHDFDSSVPVHERTVADSRELAHVRPMRETGDDGDADLRQALDAFLLSGAVKLYREAHDPSGIGYRHHTMLVHESVRMADHRESAHRIAQLWHADQQEGERRLGRLRALFECDFARVSDHHHDGFVRPVDFADLAPYLREARTRIEAGGGPVVVVNGDRDIESGTVDFDRRPVWKILVGGAKLSRGFTVEGLTVTYYRRSTSQADSLMQMGRWFGFRHGYRDLVRLYIGRGVGGEKGLGLYEAFEAACRDEDAFRAQLADYAQPADGGLAITPSQIRPLVAQYLPELKPTSASKMINARLVEIRSPGRWVEPSALPVRAATIARNTEQWRPVFSALDGPLERFSVPAHDGTRAASFSALTAIVTHAQLLDVLAGLEWEHPKVFAPHLAYLRGLGTASEPLGEWLIVAPQLASANALKSILPGAPEISLFRRTRRRPGAFGAISDPGHRRVARELLHDGERGVALLYPVIEPEESLRQPVDPTRVSVAFALLTPDRKDSDGSGPAIRFQASDA